MYVTHTTVGLIDLASMGPKHYKAVLTKKKKTLPYRVPKKPWR